MNLRRYCWLAGVLFVLPWLALGQDNESSKWATTLEANGYYFDGEAWLLPIVKTDRNKLHLEMRYNYEDFRTASAWLGYNFVGGKKLQYVITPMVGGAFGQTKGIIGGLEMTLSSGRFELYSESEYMKDFSGQENNFFYSWTDITYSPRDWWWIGISGQRTRVYQTGIEIQHGVVIGAAAGEWEFSLFAYNMELGQRLFILSINLIL